MPDFQFPTSAIPFPFSHYVPQFIPSLLHIPFKEDTESTHLLRNQGENEAEHIFFFLTCFLPILSMGAIIYLVLYFKA